MMAQSVTEIIISMFFILPNPQSIADYVSARLVDLISTKPQAVLGLATGSTMEPVYDRLTAQVTLEDIDVSQLITFNVDEYIGLGADHPQSYHYYMSEHLFNRLAFARHKTFLPDGLCVDLQEQCERYSRKIAEAGGIDLQLLGIGGNGHIGFNEPGTSFQSRTHVVDLSAQTRLDNGRFFASMDEVPTQAITLGLQDIIEAKQIILVATGNNKAQVMADLYYSAIDENMPASIIKQHNNAMIIVDEAAAKLLPSEACKPLIATV